MRANSASRTFGARPELARVLAPAYVDVGSLPPLAAPGAGIVYHDLYNFRLWGIEKLHPLDAQKFGKARCL